MKELSIEEKARRYDEAIERANELNYVSDKDSLQRKTVEHIFPELKESEDEKMRNAAINACKYMVDNFENSTKQYEDAIVWLENQGKQKSVDVRTTGYWNVQEVEQEFAWSEKYIANVFEKVGLAKIVREQSNDNLTNALQDAMIELSKFIPQPNPAWNEEDEERLQSCLNVLQAKGLMGVTDTTNTKWLKSLKDKVQSQSKHKQEETILHWENGHPKPYKSVFILRRHGNVVVEGEWSEKTGMWYQYGFQSYLEDNEVAGWMNKKSLLCNFYSCWKPSDAQIASITCAVRKMKESACYDSELVSLLNDLKKLKG